MTRFSGRFQPPEDLSIRQETEAVNGQAIYCVAVRRWRVSGRRPDRINRFFACKKSYWKGRISGEISSSRTATMALKVPSAGQKRSVYAPGAASPVSDYRYENSEQKPAISGVQLPVSMP